MDHLNVFNAYKNKAHHHEDELTRTFLILVKNIPSVQIMFLELVRQELLNFDLKRDEQIESIAIGDLTVESVSTQLGNTNELFRGAATEGRKVVSIIISDDKLNMETKVENDSRGARYDGVIFADPGWLFIVENKPLRDNIWLRQLNPSFLEEVGVKIVEQVCALSWRTVIERLNMIVQNAMVSGLEKQLIEDFIEYVDHEFSYLNPYTQFAVCKGNQYLLNKRCVAILEAMKINGENAVVDYHRGWKHYAESKKNTVKQIALDSSVEGDDWSIHLWLYAGDTMYSSKNTYSNLDIEKVKDLFNIGFKLSSNFHVSYRSSNLLWFDGKLTFEEYIQYWKKNALTLRQSKREEFIDLFQSFENSGMILPEDQHRIQEKILCKNYDRLNVCPGFVMKYTWTREEASKLDQRNQFLEDLKEKIKIAFEAIGDEIELS
ncbi:hypothetical protein [Lysinibacillus sp. RC79]|uniref:hypothetical protein n=1 Tax=Lysinibacillus sp. RC79 TaxID=3156296 RepID=UPI0035187936